MELPSLRGAEYTNSRRGILATKNWVWPKAIPSQNCRYAIYFLVIEVMIGPPE